jgi:hypothetical protein
MILHCFYCDNLDNRMVLLHQEACNLVGIKVHYSRFSIDDLARQGISPHKMHGLFIEQLLQASTQTVGIIDIDCILSSAHFLEQCKKTVEDNGTILGLAQCANHLPSRHHIYAAPAFMLINAKTWHNLGRPSLTADRYFDTAQRLTYDLQVHNLPAKIIMPDGHSGLGQSWPLSDQGTYGIGTYYGKRQAFHLFQSSKGPSYLSLLQEQVEKLRKGAKVF